MASNIVLEMFGTPQECLPYAHKPPLPFMGNKAPALKLLQDFCDYNDKMSKLLQKDNLIILDVFGGSGILSHFFKRKAPQTRVIWNDYDNYAKRLQGYGATCDVLTCLTKLSLDNKGGKDRMSPSDEAKVKDLLEQKRKEWGELDYVTLGAKLCFSGAFVTSYEELMKRGFYYMNIYNSVSDRYISKYLQGVERVLPSVDFRDLMKEFRGKNVLQVLDPPYLHSGSGHYSGFFQLGDFLDLMRLAKPPFLLFSSERSQIQQWFDYINEKFDDFRGVKRLDFKTSLISGLSSSREEKKRNYRLDHLFFLF